MLQVKTEVLFTLFPRSEERVDEQSDVGVSQLPRRPVPDAA
jgi:hypothetical protein